MEWWLGWDRFPPRWICGVGWQEDPWIGWVTIAADFAIFLVYMLIPIAIAVWLNTTEQTSVVRRVVRLFQHFVFWCGLTHLTSVVVFWVPWYPVIAFAKAVTAVVSWRTLVYLKTHGPTLLQLKLELEQDVRLFETVYRTGVIPICFVDTGRGKFLSANSAACEFFERDEATLRQLTFEQITHPDDIGVDWSEWSEVRSGKKSRMVMEKRYLMPTPNPDGSKRWKWALLIATVVRAKNGDLLHSISIIQDIDHLKVVNHALQARNEQLEDMLRVAEPDGSNIRTRLTDLLEEWKSEEKTR